MDSGAGALQSLLADAKLEHLAPTLGTVSLGSLMLRSLDRVALLAHFKALGIGKLNERRKSRAVLDPISSPGYCIALHCAFRAHSFQF